MEPKSAFLEIFGESSYIKVLDFFLTYPGFDYSKTQVADEVGISKIKLEDIWSKLKKYKLIIKSRTAGRAKFYKLNTENPKVKILMKMDLELASAELK